MSKSNVISGVEFLRQTLAGIPLTTDVATLSKIDDLTCTAANRIRELEAEVYRLTGCQFPNSQDIAVITLPSGEGWATSPAIATRICELEAEVARLKSVLDAARERGKTYNHAWKEAEAKLRAVGELPDEWRSRTTRNSEVDLCAMELEALLKGERK